MVAIKISHGAKLRKVLFGVLTKRKAPKIEAIVTKTNNLVKYILSTVFKNILVAKSCA